MAESFGDAWRRVRLHMPDAPFGLVREWTQHAYEDLTNRRPWQFTKVDAQLSVPAARDLACTCAVGSTTVTSAAGFLTTDVGLQLRVSGALPVSTIIAYVDASTVTLDQAWTGTAGAQTLQILGLYQIMPADFGAFLTCVDPSTQRPIPWWFTQTELDRIDPTRTSSGTTPRVLVAQTLSPVPATRGQARYEWWPAPTSASVVPYMYRKAAQPLADTDPLLGVLNARVLSTGALAYGAAWPGSADAKNPYFNLTLAKGLKDQFDRECAKLELRDDDQAQQTWDPSPRRGGLLDLAADTTFLRSTDATLNDYL